MNPSARSRGSTCLTTGKPTGRCSRSMNTGRGRRKGAREQGGKGARGQRGPGASCGPVCSLAPLPPCSLAALILALCLLAPTGCGPRVAAVDRPASPAVAAPLRYDDVTSRAGIRFRHVNGGFGKKWMPETMGSGCAFIDYDRDGQLDLFFVNGDEWTGPGRPRPARRPTMALYRNQGDGTFADVTAQVGLDQPLYGMGVAVGDYDGDGYDDLYVTGVEESRLYRNEGGRRFKDVTR